MKSRLLVAAVGVPLLFYIVLGAPPIVMMAALCALSGVAAMELMQVKMYKEVKNNINRKTNFETANMDKTYSASAQLVL